MPAHRDDEALPHPDASALDSLPDLDDLAADPVTHAADDLVAPAGLTNHLGTVRIDHDLTGISAVTFPPMSQGPTPTASLFVGGRLFTSYGIAVTHRWRPDRVVREAEVDGWAIRTTTVCVPGEPVVAIELAVTDTSGHDRTLELALAANARITRTTQAWLQPDSPGADNRVDLDGRGLVFTDPASGASVVQGFVGDDATARLSGVVTDPSDHEVGIGGVARGGELAITVPVAAGATVRIGYVHATGATRESAEAAFDRVAADVGGAVTASERAWTDRLHAAFTPGNDEFSGHLPRLSTRSPELRRLYWWGVLGTIWFRRDWPGNTLGRSYDTLMPNYWAATTFIWDFSLSSLTHALLDPEPMRRQLEHWADSDITTHFGTSSIDGGPVGRWYSVNHYAMTRLIDDLIRVNVDGDVLGRTVAGRPLLEHVGEWATAWRGLRRGSALADYGEIDNLLECVSSYTHEVASLNAANVWCLRAAAALHRHRGEIGTAEHLESAAAELLPHVLELHEPGTGWFAARQPDGTRLPVRHCYDFSLVGTLIGDDLPEPVRTAMIDFFVAELRTPNWMRALSPYDPDAAFSVRPDHQWNGAYPAWPADAARSLIALGAADVVLDWLPGLAATANQGPPGQAHFVTEAEPSIGAGARKAPPQLPYINDWACSSAGAWVELIIRGLFGVEHGLDGEVTAGGPVGRLDPDAVLHGLRVGERLVDVSADGSVVSAESSLR